MRKAKRSTWADNSVQFPRLLAEIRAVGLTPEQDAALCESMDLTENRIAEIFERAETEWERIVARMGVRHA